jgi:hypothetical protein
MYQSLITSSERREPAGGSRLLLSDLNSSSGGASMTAEEKERMNFLCKQIQVEQDETKFTELVSELNELLETKEHRLTEKQKIRRQIDGGGTLQGGGALFSATKQS